MLARPPARRAFKTGQNNPRGLRAKVAARAGGALLAALGAGVGTVALAQPAADQPAADQPAADQPQVEVRTKPLLETGGLRFRDLEADGVLAPFEDWRLSPADRASDLVGRMNLAEKVGMLMHSTLPTLPPPGAPGAPGAPGKASGYDLEALGVLLGKKHVNSFITRLSLPSGELAHHNNEAQAAAEATRLGIPITISTDPRSHFQYVFGASEGVADMTQWPELLGFASLRDPALVERFASIARREYRAVGIHMTLSPQLDLVTEPRWARIAGTFGSDARLTSEMGRAYVTGFQGGAKGLAADGVLAVIKHWVGYGAQPEGFDAHNHYGRFAIPGQSFDLHVEAFRGALEAGAGGVMPAYPILLDTQILGRPADPVSPGFSPLLLNDLLRGTFGYQGIILSDWAITRDCTQPCLAPTRENPQGIRDVATPWGVEHLSVGERYGAGLAAGLDQFGGTDDVAPLFDAIGQGLIDIARIDQSLRRILIAKFTLGLFENPYVDPDRAHLAVGQAPDRALARRVQSEAQVLLRNDRALVPLAPALRRVWLHGVDPQAALAAGLVVVDHPQAADFILVRANTPSELLHPHHFFGSFQTEGRLDFRPRDPAYEALATAPADKPRILAIFLDRPAVLTPILPHSDVILANFGASDAAVFDVLLGKHRPLGRLPFQLPASMEQVERQHPGTPDDIADPLFPAGAGIMLP